MDQLSENKAHCELLVEDERFLYQYLEGKHDSASEDFYVELACENTKGSAYVQYVKCVRKFAQIYWRQAHEQIHNKLVVNDESSTLAILPGQEIEKDAHHE